MFNSRSCLAGVVLLLASSSPLIMRIPNEGEVHGLFASTKLGSKAKSDQVSARAAGVASSLTRNIGVKEIGRGCLCGIGRLCVSLSFRVKDKAIENQAVGPALPGEVVTGQVVFKDKKLILHNVIWVTSKDRRLFHGSCLLEAAIRHSGGYAAVSAL
eukprot:1155461-Pelagomonas_calceolata.AAC.1